jgi:hypothetical protein
MTFAVGSPGFSVVMSIPHPQAQQQHMLVVSTPNFAPMSAKAFGGFTRSKAGLASRKPVVAPESFRKSLLVIFTLLPSFPSFQEI